ncbi:hypothetical protein [Oceanobacillus alkalisoli]|uniref:hypothetical protein n=1 Tax=Oceanobacillus alkalisoli TaxID=2925113 RepID=UPI001EF0F856|nr:hypothetical protein [Oceanobacillus alkalisoli]MCF3943704.1 hypothetical protein [Oceanobacillus alkalisoli]MCG5104115.1 hypothetical protein [Oceanobacillus alkalisoli]
MNNQVKGLIYYYAQDMKHQVKIFWLILITITVATSIMAYFLMDVADSQFFWAFPFATYTNVAIIAFQSVKKDIPFGLKMGAIRKNIFLSYMYFFFGYSLFIAVAGNTLQLIFERLLNLFGITNYIFGHPAMLLSDTWLTRTVIDTFVMFFLMALLFIIGLIFYHFGLLGGRITLGVLLVVTMYGLFEGWLIEAFVNLIPDVSMLTFVTIFLIGIGLYLISYLFIRRVTVVRKV